MLYCKKSEGIDLCVEEIKGDKEGIPTMFVKITDEHGNVSFMTKTEFEKNYVCAESAIDGFVSKICSGVENPEELTKDDMEDGEYYFLYRSKWLFESGEFSYSDAWRIVEKVAEELNSRLNLKECVFIMEEEGNLCIYSSEYVLENEDIFTEMPDTLELVKRAAMDKVKDVDEVIASNITKGCYISERNGICKIYKEGE